MLLSIAADERAALHFEDLASALDAGLPVTAVGGDPAAGERVVHSALAGRGVRLSPTEDAVLLHAWRAGRVGAALRGRAIARRRHVEFVRQVWAGVRYPLLLMLMILLASAATGAIVGYGFLIGVVVVYTLLAVAGLLVRRGTRRGEPWVQRLPGVARLLGGLAELPYLETLHALYGAGVPLKTAHPAAVAAVQNGDVAARLRIADGIVQSGRPLREGLAEALALHGETRSLIDTGEQTGQLEDALRRALERRRDVTGRETTAAARRVGQVAYAAAVVACVVIIFRFYSGYLGMLHR